jgi:hypothetical protein
MNQPSEQSNQKQLQASHSADTGLSDATQRSTQEQPNTLTPKSTANGGSAPAVNDLNNVTISVMPSSTQTISAAEPDDGGSQDTCNNLEERTVSSTNLININGNASSNWADQTASEYQSQEELNGYMNGDDMSQNGHHNDDAETSSNMNGTQRDERSPHRRPYHVCTNML